MIVDANVLLYSVDETSVFRGPARDWLTAALDGPERIGLPWPPLHAFLRISTNPRAVASPLSPADAWEHVAGWLDAPAAWVPVAGTGHAAILESLVIGLDLRDGLIADAAIAALALDYGVAVISADSDFARFPKLTWVNPVASR